MSYFSMPSAISHASSSFSTNPYALIITLHAEVLSIFFFRQHIKAFSARTMYPFSPNRGGYGPWATRAVALGVAQNPLVPLLRQVHMAVGVVRQSPARQRLCRPLSARYARTQDGKWRQLPGGSLFPSSCRSLGFVGRGKIHLQPGLRSVVASLGDRRNTRARSAVAKSGRAEGMGQHQTL